MSTIHKDNIRNFDLQYKRAVQLNNETFKFEGQVVLTAYAKYLLEYFRMRGIIK